MSSLLLRRPVAAARTTTRVGFRAWPSLIPGALISAGNEATIFHFSQSSHLSLTTRNFFGFPAKEDKRIRDIIVNPKSMGSKIQPGNLVDKYYKKTKNTRTIPLELAEGYFWMIKDLRVTEEKPTLSNPKLIPAKNAQPFPSLLAGVTTLSGEEAELPEFFIKKNRSKDEHAQCTLVAISCRDHGFKSLHTWTEPFETAFEGQPRVEVCHLHITEGWFTAGVLGPLITRMIKNNTPPEKHNNTLICMRRDLEEFRDALRIHNLMCGYVFLLDGIGRVRFAGSGQASPEETKRLIQFADDLTQSTSGTDKTNKRRKSKRRVAG